MDSGTSVAARRWLSPKHKGLARLAIALEAALRSNGLSLVKTIFTGKDESPKVLIRHSRQLAVAQCAIHILPAFVSISMVALTLVGYFIGGELQGTKNQDSVKLGALQLAAKAQELLIISSIGSIMFHHLQQELATGTGLPLGLVVSGFSFSRLSYFWSSEFWGGALSKHTTSQGRWRHRGLICFVIWSGLVAIMAGPASAVLMIPRVKDTTIGGGSDSALWPTDLNKEYLAGYNCSTEERRFNRPECPSYGYSIIYQFFDQWWNFPDRGYDFVVTDHLGRKTFRQVLTDLGDPWTMGIHAATGKMQGAMFSFHGKSLDYLIHNYKAWIPTPRNLLYASAVRSEVAIKAPLVRTVCWAQDEVDHRSGNITIRFPRLTELDPSGHLSAAIDVSDHIKSALFDRGFLNSTEQPLRDEVFAGGRQILIVPMDIWDHTASSLGLIMLFAKELIDADETTWGGNVMACSVDARWAKGRSVINTTPLDDLTYEFVEGRTRNVLDVQLDVELPDRLGIDKRHPPDGALQQIRIWPSWYDVFSPLAPAQLPVLDGPRDTQQTTLEKLVQISYRPEREERGTQALNKNYKYQRGYASIISVSVADSISRCGLIPNTGSTSFLGAWDDFEWTVKDKKLAGTMLRFGDPLESFSKPEVLKDWDTTRQVMRARYTGYIMSAQGRFDYFCIVLLLQHALVAIVHSAWVIYQRKTSSAWDTILEMLTLALKSLRRPPMS